jgi:aminoglycoside/choline kinase family phosphotransferase
MFDPIHPSGELSIFANRYDLIIFTCEIQDRQSMIKDELLSLLFHEYTGNSPENLVVLPKSGSDRIYLRMTRGDFSVLGVWNPNRKENDAFTGFAGHFKSLGLRVPGVYKYLPEEMVYLTEDLGELDLCTWVMKYKGAPGGEEKIQEMYRKVFRELVRFQFEADKELNYGLCYPRSKFDRSSVMWDLYYFKYMFLKLSGTAFNEQLLEDDFMKIVSEIENVKTEGFLYRDFQSRNIMIKDEQPWFIDFQGGRKGAPHYDVASLLLDPYTELGSQLHDQLLDYYLSLLRIDNEREKNRFITEYRIFGVVRLLQALGTYGLRGLYERKPGFTESISPAVRQLNRTYGIKEIRDSFPELSQIVKSLHDNWAGSDARGKKTTTVIIESFSFRKGIPETFIAGGGFLFDCRYLADPCEDEGLRPLNGKDKKVIEFFERKKETQVMAGNAFHLIVGSLESSEIEKKGALRVCFGSNSGIHRSVYCAEAVASMLKGRKNAEVLVYHNEIR